MPMKKAKLSGSLFLTAVAVSCLLVFSSFAAASQIDLNAIRNAIRQRGAQWRAGETSISRLPEAQRLKRLGLKKPATVLSKKQLLTASPPTGATLPSVLDYRNYNGMDYVTPIRDQGNCGSCWAFATTAALESQVLMDTSMSTDEAEQILISCSGAGSCAGGYIDKASSFIESTGLPAETCFPYSDSNNHCSNASCPDWQSDTYKISGWRYVTGTSPTVDALKNALYTYGPLVTTMNVYSDFYYYTGGVYSYTKGSYQGGHAIELIGWDDDAQCFIVKNSWGTSWGESGFFEIAYSQLTNAVAFGDYTIAYTGSNNNISTCSYSIYPTSMSFTSAGGDGTISVYSQSACNWSAVSNTPWITITSGANGSSNGTVGYSVAANTTRKNRSGSLTVAGQTFTVTQQKKGKQGRRNHARWRRIRL